MERLNDIKNMVAKTLDGGIILDSNSFSNLLYSKRSWIFYIMKITIENVLKIIGIIILIALVLRIFGVF